MIVIVGDIEAGSDDLDAYGIVEAFGAHASVVGRGRAHVRLAENQIGGGLGRRGDGIPDEYPVVADVTHDELGAADGQVFGPVEGAAADAAIIGRVRGHVGLAEHDVSGLLVC